MSLYLDFQVTRDIALEVNHEVTSSELLSIIHENGEDI